MVYRTTARGLARRRERSELLLATARLEFAKNGYHATSVPRIVAAAQSSIGAFYLYFKSKEEIFIAVLGLIERELSQALNAAQRSVPDDVVGSMRVTMETFVEYLGTHPGDARILLLEAPSLAGEIHSAWRAIIESHTRSVEHALKAISPRVELPDLTTAATCWVGAITEAVLRWLEKRPQDRPPAQTLSRTVVEFNLNAIRARKSKRKERRS